MKKFFIIVFGLLLTFSIVRSMNNAQPLTLTAFMNVLKEFPIDIREDLTAFIGLASEVGDGFIEYGNMFADRNLSALDVVKEFFGLVWNCGRLIIGLIELIVRLIYDVLVVFTRIFYLLFGIEFSMDDVPGGFIGGAGGGSDFGDFGGGGFGGGGGGARP